MRRYDIVTGILLILSIIDFTLAAPVSVQEKHQARVDVVNMPKDVITVVEKRGDEELEMVALLAEEIFNKLKSVNWRKPFTSKSPTPDPAPSTANPEPESSCLGNCLTSTVDTLKRILSADHPPMRGAGGYAYGPYYKLPMMDAPQPEEPWIHPSADPDFDWHHWMNTGDPPPPSKPTPPRPAKMKGQASGHAPGAPPGEYDPDLESYPESVVNSPSLGASSPKEPEPEVVLRPPPSPDTKSHLDDQTLGAGSGSGSQPPDLQAPASPPSPHSELHSDPGPQSLSALSQPVDFQAVVYGLKGKAKAKES